MHPGAPTYARPMCRNIRQLHNFEPQATTDEVIAVGEALRTHGGIYMTHLRDEADEVLASIRETLRIGRECGRGSTNRDSVGDKPVLLGYLFEQANPSFCFLFSAALPYSKFIQAKLIASAFV